MKLKKLLAASVGLGTLAGAAYAQSDVDFTDERIKIRSDDCAYFACSEITSSTPLEAKAFILDAMEQRNNAFNMATFGPSGPGDDKKKGQGNALGRGDNSPQVVYLQFGSADPTFQAFNAPGVPIGPGVFNDYIYTQADRDLIQSRLEADYEQYNYIFTQTLPSDGPFSTLRIGDNDANPIIFSQGILFGQADNIDFRNDDRGDSAFVDASFWQLLAELDANFGTQNLANFLGLPGPLDAAGIETFRQIAVVGQSANTASHELGHIQGLRHHDSFGAPGDGLPPARSPGEFIPVLETDQNALETLSHIMASGASAGLALNSPPFVDRFFSERSAVKLALNGRTRELSEDAATGNNGVIELRKVVSPNPLLSGQNADGGLDIRGALVRGRLDNPDQVDSYGIRGEAGKVFNAEIISFSDSNIDDFILAAQLTLKQKQSDGSLVEVASNITTFEGFEPLLFDFTIPETGDYVIEVSAPSIVPFGGGLVDLDALGLTALRDGDYDLNIYIVEGKLGGGPGALPGPSN